MILAGLLTGAQKGILYIRHEYEEQEKILRDEIRRCQRKGLLGRDLLGSDFAFELEIFVSPGGYICGEETALLEAIEGKRAEPRNKPPFPVQQGLWNKPTVINNVETFANVPPILLRGVDWYKSQGQGGAAGLKFIGVSGDVVRPGVFEVPMGTPVSELIFKYGGGIPDGKKLKAFRAIGTFVGIFAGVHGRCPPRFQIAGRCGFDARLRRPGRLRGRSLHAGYGAERDASFSATNRAANAFPAASVRRNSSKCCLAGPQGKGSARDLALIDELSARLAADFDLRTGPGGARADRLGVETFSRRSRIAHSAPRVPFRSLPLRRSGRPRLRCSAQRPRMSPSQ